MKRVVIAVAGTLVALVVVGAALAFRSTQMRAERIAKATAAEELREARQLMEGFGNWLDKSNPMSSRIAVATMIATDLPRGMHVVAAQPKDGSEPVQLQLYFSDPDRVPTRSTFGPAVILAVCQTSSDSIDGAIQIYEGSVEGKFARISPTRQDVADLELPFAGEAIGGLVPSQTIQWIDP